MSACALRGVAAMNWKRDSIGLAFLISALYCLTFPIRLAAQDPAPEDQTQGADATREPGPHRLWPWVKQGNISFDARFRVEGFERDGAPFTATAFAPTLRLALGYETHPIYGFSAFAQGEAVIVTGPADYNDPTLPSQNRPNLPTIADPKSLELSQGYVKWTHGAEHKRASISAGRQELVLNDGRFLGYSSWRQVHGSFDAAKMDLDLPRNFSLTYAFINRFYRQVGYDATDGHPPMHTDLINLVWTKQDRVRASLYGLLLDYRSPAQFALSTQTYGLRVNGPYRLSTDWRIIYTAEFAKQKNYGTNPNRVDENYYLGELGPGWRGLNIKAGYAFLGGRNATDLLTTPLAPPFNGWTDLFFNNPSGHSGNGLQASYINVNGPIRYLDGAVATVIYYDYHSDYPRVHYGSEFDSSLSYKMKRFDNRWEIGWRFGRYWADRLFTNAVRTSVYTSFTL
jgi:hypothetical protein